MTALTSPPDWAIKLALDAGAQSTCRSKRGVAIYVPTKYDRSEIVLGTGFNGAPPGFNCPGDCARGTCGRRAVHAEMRALFGARGRNGFGDLVHVELAADGGVVACDGPTCEQCSKHIVDGGQVLGVWLYEAQRLTAAGRGRALLTVDPECDAVTTRAVGAWRYYSAADFHRTTLENCGMVP